MRSTLVRIAALSPHRSCRGLNPRNECMKLCVKGQVAAAHRLDPSWIFTMEFVHDGKDNAESCTKPMPLAQKVESGKGLEHLNFSGF